jgi:5-oxoprolinase (ATP-hydrolysing) subunit C
VVDLGRPRTRSLGVPFGGAADRASLMIGNALVGNSANSAGLEICAVGPTLRAECDLACVVFGAPFDLAGPEARIRANTTFTLPAGGELRIGGTPRGLRAYFCVRGGLDVPEILGSHSGLEALVAGTVLACRPGKIGGRFLPEGVFASWHETGPLRVLPGAQFSGFDATEFSGQEFTAHSASDRMGLRLKGPPLTFQPMEITSEPVCPGTVQVTRDGQCIILGVDGQTIGGYPKIAHVIDADLDRLGQIRPGHSLRFELVELAEALALGKKRQQELSEWMLRLGVAA